MKIIVKIVLASILAIAAAFGCRYIFTEMGNQLADGNTPVQLVENAMVEARTMFLEQPDAIQHVTAAVLDQEGLELLRNEEGKPAGADGRVYTLPDPEQQAALDGVFGDFACGGRVRNLVVKADAVLFYVDYPGAGCAGFLYEREEGDTQYYDYLELVENWKIFYHIPKE